MDAEQLIEDFALFDDWEERYAYLIELGRKLPALAEHEMNDITRVRGCVSQVWLIPERDGQRILFRADSDAFIVKGLVAILLMLYSGRTADEILAVPIEQIFEDLGLAGHLTPSRRNGFFSMVERIRQVAADT